MLWLITLLLALVWLAAYVLQIGQSFLHLLLVVAAVLVVVQLIVRRHRRTF